MAHYCIQLHRIEWNTKKKITNSEKGWQKSPYPLPNFEKNLKETSTS